MKSIMIIVGACVIGCFIGTINFRSSSDEKGKLSPIQNGLDNQGMADAAFDIVEIEDYSIATRHRTSIKILFKNRTTDTETIRKTLLKLAESQNADAVLAYAYRIGDDWHDSYTAGKLEWAKNGGAWASGEHLPPEGKFEAKTSSANVDVPEFLAQSALKFTRTSREHNHSMIGLRKASISGSPNSPEFLFPIVPDMHLPDRGREIPLKVALELDALVKSGKSLKEQFLFDERRKSEYWWAFVEPSKALAIIDAGQNIPVMIVFQLNCKRILSSMSSVFNETEESIFYTTVVTHCRLRASSIDMDCLGLIEMALQFRLAPPKQWVRYGDLLGLYYECRLRGVSHDDSIPIMKQAIPLLNQNRK